MATTGPFKLLPLPWTSANGFESFMSSKSIEMHYQKQREYVDKMNSLAQQNPELQSMSLADIVNRYPGTFRDIAAEILNHEFFWKCLSPSGSRQPNLGGVSPGGANPSQKQLIAQQGPSAYQGGIPSGRIYELIVKNFGTIDNFVFQFSQTAIGQFGSGWIWLVYSPKEQFLLIMPGDGAYNPIMDGYTPLLTLDLWEHSYWCDHSTNIPSYVNNFWKYVNWNYLNVILAQEIFGDIPRTY